MIRPGSQNAAILDVLADEQWHTTRQIHAAAGYSRLNSRISELRDKHQLAIESEHLGGTGVDAWQYRWVREPEQLTLEDAA